MVTSRSPGGCFETSHETSTRSRLHRRRCAALRRRNSPGAVRGHRRRAHNVTLRRARAGRPLRSDGAIDLDQLASASTSEPGRSCIPRKAALSLADLEPVRGLRSAEPSLNRSCGHSSSCVNSLVVVSRLSSRFTSRTARPYLPPTMSASAGWLKATVLSLPLARDRARSRPYGPPCVATVGLRRSSSGRHRHACRRLAKSVRRTFCYTYGGDAEREPDLPLSARHDTVMRRARPPLPVIRSNTVVRC